MSYDLRLMITPLASPNKFVMKKQPKNVKILSFGNQIFVLI